MSDKEDIRQLSLEELTDKLVALGEKPYRAKQIHEWLWKKNVKSFDDMSSIAQKTRNVLKDIFWINQLNTQLAVYCLCADH